MRWLMTLRTPSYAWRSTSMACSRTMKLNGSIRKRNSLGLTRLKERARDIRTIHLVIGEVAPEVAGHPKLHIIQLGCTEVPSVNLKGSIETAKVFHCRAVACLTAVSGRFGAIEIALTEHRTTTSLYDSSVERPINCGVFYLLCHHGSPVSDREDEDGDHESAYTQRKFL